MKKIIYSICYVLAFCIGIILLIFNHQASSTDASDHSFLINLFIGVGVVFVIPGLSLLIANLRPKKEIPGEKPVNTLPTTLTGIIALVWGILILIMPKGLFGNLNITLGVSLIIIAFAQIIWIARGKEKNGAPLWLYIIPVLVAAAGVAILFLKKDYQTPGKELETGCIFAGIVLMFWAANGFLSLPRRKKTEADIEADEKKLEHDQKKLENQKPVEEKPETGE